MRSLLIAASLALSSAVAAADLSVTVCTDRRFDYDAAAGKYVPKGPRFPPLNVGRTGKALVCDEPETAKEAVDHRDLVPPTVLLWDNDGVVEASGVVAFLEASGPYPYNSRGPFLYFLMPRPGTAAFGKALLFTQSVVREMTGSEMTLPQDFAALHAEQAALYSAALASGSNQHQLRFWVEADNWGLGHSPAFAAVQFGLDDVTTGKNLVVRKAHAVKSTDDELVSIIFNRARNVAALAAVAIRSSLLSGNPVPDPLAHVGGFSSYPSPAEILTHRGETLLTVFGMDYGRDPGSSLPPALDESSSGYIKDPAEREKERLRWAKMVAALCAANPWVSPEGKIPEGRVLVIPPECR